MRVKYVLSEVFTGLWRNVLDGELRGDPLVDSVEYESKQQAYDNFTQLYEDSPDLVESVKPDTLPESFRVKLNNPEKFKEISERYQDKAGVDDIVDQKELLGRVFSILGSIQSGALIV